MHNNSFDQPSKYLSSLKKHISIKRAYQFTKHLIIIIILSSTAITTDYSFMYTKNEIK